MSEDVYNRNLAGSVVDDKTEVSQDEPGGSCKMPKRWPLSNLLTEALVSNNKSQALHCTCARGNWLKKKFENVV